MNTHNNHNNPIMLKLQRYSDSENESSFQWLPDFGM